MNFVTNGTEIREFCAVEQSILSGIELKFEML
jgi:hypothetical protein